MKDVDFVFERKPFARRQLQTEVTGEGIWGLKTPVCSVSYEIGGGHFDASRVASMSFYTS